MTRLRLSLVLILLVGLAFALNVRAGLDTEGRPITFFGRLAPPMAMAISQLGHGLGEGYAAYDRVYDTLWRVSEPRERADDTAWTPERYNRPRHPAEIDAAMAQAARLEDPGRLGHVLIVHDDKGSALYHRLAYRLFGLHLSSLDTLYFLLLGLAVAAFVLAHHRRPAAMVLLLLLLCGHLAAMSMFLSWPGGERVYHPRFAPALGVIPLLHLALAMVGAPPGRGRDVALGAVQALLCILVLHIRSSFGYALPFLVTLPLAARWLPGWRDPWPARWWPLGLVAVALLLLKLHLLFTASPLLGGVAGRHIFWPPLYAGLGSHPEALPRYGIVYGNDMVGTAVWTRAEQALGPNFFRSAELTARYEGMVREEYLRLVREEPGFVITAYGYKVLMFVQTFLELSRGAWPHHLVAGGLAAVGAWLWGRWRVLGRPRREGAALAWLIPFALLPGMIAMPLPLLIAEVILLFCAVLYGAIGVALALGTRRFHDRGVR